MARRPAAFTKDEILRAMKAADEMGWKTVVLKTKEGSSVTLCKDAVTEKEVAPAEEFTL